jgi:hypothetical protein
VAANQSVLYDVAMRALAPALAAVLLYAGIAADAVAAPAGRTHRIDREYTDAIRRYTTAPEFLSDLVDPVPRSRRVPSPLEFLGYVPGAEGELTYSADIHAYMRELAKRSRRVRVFSIGKTEEGRENILVVIATPGALRRLDRYKEINRELADPREIDDDEARRLIGRGKPMYWLTGGLHPPETGSPEMLMELAYRLAVGTDPMVRNIRRNVITMITPVLEVDGRDRMVDTVRWWQKHEKVGLPPLVYWGRYVAHDNNRDSMALSLALTRNVLGTFLDYHPQVLHDLHESVPFLYISTGTGPYNAWLDPIAVDTWQQLAQHEVAELTRRGMPGVWTHGFWDGWSPSYLFHIAHGHNALGRFYETFGNATPETRERRVKRRSSRAWYRPNPPYPVVQWSLRNNVNYQQSGALVALENVASRADHFLELSYTLAKRAVAKARTEGPAAYVFPADQPHRGQLRELLRLLEAHGVEIHRTTASATVTDHWPPKRRDSDGDATEDEDDATEAGATGGEDGATDGDSDQPRIVELPLGSHVVRMDQPYSRLADTLLDTQYYRPDDERPYDDTGWTLSHAKGVTAHRIVTTDVLDVPMEIVENGLATEPVRPASADADSLALVANADTDMVRYLWRTTGSFRVLDEPAKVAGRTLPRGTILVQANPENLKAADGLGVELVAVPHGPAVRSHETTRPRIALVHTWYRTQDEGWYRIALDQLGIPYDYISTQDVAASTDLGERYDVVLFPPCGCGPNDIMWGLPDGPPIPWKKTELTPNLGRIDATDDIRPGLGVTGLANLRAFVRAGGTLITIGDTAGFAVQYGLAPEVSVATTSKLKVHGSLLRAEIADTSSPVVYGYDEALSVYFAGGGPVFRVGRFQPPKEDDNRPSGRGGVDDPDVPQGRPFVGVPDDDELPPHERGYTPWDRDTSTRLRVRTPAVDQRPRVVLRYAKCADDLLVSGMLGGADELAGTPALIDAPLGAGHVILFGINPMWRFQTQGSFALVFNAMLNRAALSTGWPPEPSRRS